MKCCTYHIAISVILTVAVGFFLSACNTEVLELTEQRTGAAYFPIAEGMYRTYEVTEIEYVISKQNDTSIYQLKEVYSEPFINLESDTSWKVKRYVRQSENEEWKLGSVWSARKSPTRVVVSEENVPYVKLIFPLQELLAWNGNVLNDKEEEEYRINEPSTLFATPDSSTIENALTVYHYYENDIITKTDIRKEVFAENIGLVEKQSLYRIYDLDESTDEDTVISSGRDFVQKLVDYGVE